jgi:CRP-like cAMP-binding protein/cation transporter-like permease
MAHEDLLAKINAFKNVSTEDLQALSGRLTEKRVPKGEIVFRQGERDSARLFIVEHGRIDITAGQGHGHVELTKMAPGQYFGELALFDGSPRSATATASEDARLLVLEREDFLDYIRKHPKASLAILAELGARLRHTNALVSRATEEFQKLGGTEALDAPYSQVRFGEMIKKRGGWLAALFLGEMLTATAMGHFEGEIARAVVLALFVPLIISSGGNSGSQATSLVIRALALKDVLLGDWPRVLKREIASGATLGVLLGAIGFFRIALWQALGWGSYGTHPWAIALTVWISLIGVVTFGTIAGSMLPFLLRRLGFDPATASAPFVATLVDVTGLVIYFTTASVILRGLLL